MRNEYWRRISVEDAIFVEIDYIIKSYNLFLVAKVYYICEKKHYIL